jgi:hypothetical protein
MKIELLTVRPKLERALKSPSGDLGVLGVKYLIKDSTEVPRNIIFINR